MRPDVRLKVDNALLSGVLVQVHGGNPSAGLLDPAVDDTKMVRDLDPLLGQGLLEHRILLEGLELTSLFQECMA